METSVIDGVRDSQASIFAARFTDPATIDCQNLADKYTPQLEFNILQDCFRNFGIGLIICELLSFTCFQRDFIKFINHHV